ncbi:MAG: hypothetical protein LPH21_06075, partial [Shewanella sp.]|nr:hypothetical protein [Shewanella sp.]
MSLLRLSIAKLGFLMPLFCDQAGMLLSGHQRTAVTDSLGIDVLPIETIDVDPEKTRGINIMFNRATNDFGAMDTGSKAAGKINIQELIEQLEKLPTLSPRQWPVMHVKERNIKQFAKQVSNDYDKKA